MWYGDAPVGPVYDEAPVTLGEVDVGLCGLVETDAESEC